MKDNVPINVLIATVYATIAAGVAYVLKKALTQDVSVEKAGSKQPCLLIVRGWFMKYSMFGCLLNKSRKYLLKQLFLIAFFSALSFFDNKRIVWPVSLIAVILPCMFYLFEFHLNEVISNKVNPEKQISSFQRDANTMQNLNLPQINLLNRQDIIIVQDAPTVVNQQKPKEEPTFNILGSAVLGSIALVAIILLLFSMVSLSKSISNTGQLSIVSICLMLAVDQLAIRPLFLLTLVSVCLSLDYFSFVPLEQNPLYCRLCCQWLVEPLIDNVQVPEVSVDAHLAEINNGQQVHSGLTDIFGQPLSIIEQEGDEGTQESLDDSQELRQRVQQTILSAKKSQSKLQKTIPRYASKNSASKENHGRFDETIVNQFYLTTAEKRVFQSDGCEQNRQNCNETERKKAYSAVKPSIIYSSGKSTEKQSVVDAFPDIVLIGNLEDDTLGAQGPSRVFYSRQMATVEIRGHSQERRAHRTTNGFHPRKNKRRQLVLNGSSPYLEYLPNMLKKTDRCKKDRHIL